MQFIKVFFTLCVLALVVIAGFAGWIWHDLHTKIYHHADVHPIEVRKGESLEQILNKLSDRGVLDSTLPLRIYLKITHDVPVVMAGQYTFNSPISPLEVLPKLKQGGDYVRLTVIEGWTRWDIAEAMTKIPELQLGTKDEALRLIDDYGLIHDIDPKAQNLEGYLFPDTYFIVPNTTARELVKQMVSRFKEVWKEKLQARASTSGKSTHELVTIASIIETEAKLKEERPLVASVIENRLKLKMPLSMDSTIVYASKMAGAWKGDGKVYQSDLDRTSAYNTRKNAGLPPGPVGSPGLSSLEAAVTPATTNYLFYVRNPSRNDGAHNFYADAKSFETGVQALRDWEQKVRH